MLEQMTEKSVQAWLNDPAIEEVDKTEIRRLVESRDDAGLTDRFYQDLEFGTGGMRVLGAGRNRMNVYTVGSAIQGLANYISKSGEAAKRPALPLPMIAGRMSDVFAERAACVLAANGIYAYLFDALRPTPELSFAVRHLKCTAGIVITASHNPPEYNGLKVYWSDGAQVVPPQDGAIISEVRAVGSFSNVRLAEEGPEKKHGLIRRIGTEIDEAFLAGVDASCLCPELCRKHGERIKIVYTPLHGTGYRLVPEALKRRGFRNVMVEASQSEPNGEFPTVTSPNPEEAAAMERGIALAIKENAELVIATDPDADRAGIAVRKRDGSFALLTGNRIGALLTHFICEQSKANGAMPDNGVVLSTVVSSDLAKEIARSHGAEVIETLTGFKWIAEEIRKFDECGAGERPTKTFLFGMEESYGYLPNAFVRDKDAVTSCAFIADAAAFAAERGQSLYDMLEALFTQYGYFEEGAKSVTMKGKRGADQIKALMHSLRENPPRSLAGVAVETVADLMTGAVRRARDGAEVGRFKLPASDVVMFSLADGTKVIARPSGTEPKIKFYILARSAEKNLAKAESACREKIAAINNDLSGTIERTTNG
ncbi:MAG: phospho-sugar mutase [Planctomycetes bacterium]|nr:phospho-sugar mutase [Planctomycetota bacterium]